MFEGGGKENICDEDPVQETNIGTHGVHEAICKESMRGE